MQSIGVVGDTIKIKNKKKHIVRWDAGCIVGSAVIKECGVVGRAVNWGPMLSNSSPGYIHSTDGQRIAPKG